MAEIVSQTIIIYTITNNSVHVKVQILTMSIKHYYKQAYLHLKLMTYLYMNIIWYFYSSLNFLNNVLNYKKSFFGLYGNIKLLKLPPSYKKLFSNKTCKLLCLSCVSFIHVLLPNLNVTKIISDDIFHNIEAF